MCVVSEHWRSGWWKKPASTHVKIIYPEQPFTRTCIHLETDFFRPPPSCVLDKMLNQVTALRARILLSKAKRWTLASHVVPSTVKRAITSCHSLEVLFYFTPPVLQCQNSHQNTPLITGALTAFAPVFGVWRCWLKRRTRLDKWRYCVYLGCQRGGGESLCSDSAQPPARPIAGGMPDMEKGWVSAVWGDFLEEFSRDLGGRERFTNW